MPTESVSTPSPDGRYTDYWKVRNWVSSERIGGKLRLRSNPYTYLSGQYGTRSYPPGYDTWLPNQPPSGLDVPSAVYQQYGIPGLEGRCYSSIRRKLYEGSAALGVTFGSMAQSRAMITARANTLRSWGADVVAEVSSAQRRHGTWGTKTLETVANAHLEVIFGWSPLISDIKASCDSVIQLADVYTFVKTGAASTGYVDLGLDRYATRARVSYSAAVRIDNPNKWLAERAGLLNPATVAWDLVPWSFVVNMFVNVNQLVQQITDFAGLEFSAIWRTQTVSYGCSRDASLYGIPVKGFWKGYDKRRSESELPTPPSLTLRVPNADWDTAAMAASLFIQQFTKVSKLLGPYEREFHRWRK